VKIRTIHTSLDIIKAEKAKIAAAEDMVPDIDAHQANDIVMLTLPGQRPRQFRVLANNGDGS